MTQFVPVFDDADNNMKKRALPRVVAGAGIIVGKSVIPATGATTYQVTLDGPSVQNLIGPATNTTPGLTTYAVPSEYPSVSNAEAATPGYVNTAITAALNTLPTDPATDTQAGVVELAVAANYPSITNDEDAATPAYVAAAIAAIPAVPNATDTVRGISSLAVAANYPSTSNTEATTPAYVTTAVNTAIAAIPATPIATDTVQGIVSLAVATNYPSLSDTEAATAAYVNAAIAAIPADKFLTNLASYNATTNVMTLNMSDGSTVPVDLTGLVNDAVASVPVATDTVQGKVSLAVAANHPSTSNTEAATPAYVNAAIAAIPATPVATDTVAGITSLAVAANYPSLSDTEAATPAYITLALQNLPLRPEDFGAIGDGVADDGAALALWAAAGGGDRVLELTPGASYRTVARQPITFAGTSIVNGNGGTIVFDYSDSSDNSQVLTGIDTHVNGVNLRWTGANYAERGLNIQTGSVWENGKVFSDLEQPVTAVDGSTDRTVTLSGAGAVLRDTEFTNILATVRLNNVNTEVINCSFYTYARGILIEDIAAGAKVEENKFFTISSVASQDPGECAVTGAANNAVIRDNTVHMASEHAFYISSGAVGGATGVVVSNNTVLASEQSNYKIRNCDVKFTSNTAQDSAFGNATGTTEDAVAFEDCIKVVLDDFTVSGVTKNIVGNYTIRLDSCAEVAISSVVTERAKESTILITDSRIRAGLGGYEHVSTVVNDITVIDPQNTEFVKVEFQGNVGDISITNAVFKGGSGEVLTTDIAGTVGSIQLEGHLNTTGTLHNDILGGSTAKILTLDMIQELFTNKAVTLTDKGVMNSDGTLGFRSIEAATIADALLENGATVSLGGPATHVLPNGSYDGQILFLQFGGTGTSILNGQLRGIVRGSAGGMSSVGGGAPANNSYWEPREAAILRWEGSSWTVFSTNIDLVTPVQLANAISNVSVSPWVSQTSIATADATTDGIGNIVNYPTNAAIALADFADADAASTAISLDMSEALFSNRAVEPTAKGMMNTDGTLGNYSKTTNLAGFANDNGATLSVSGGTTTVLPAGKYVGQTAIISTGGSGTAIVQGNIRGFYRDVTGNIVSSNGATVVDTYWLITESFHIRWNGTFWLITAVSRDIKQEPLVPVNDIASLTGGDLGLSLGIANISTLPLTIAQTTQAYANRVAVSLEDLRYLYTNRAAEPTAVGMMNDNGLLGHHSSVLSTANGSAGMTTSLADYVSKYNGALVRLSANNGDIATMPPPAYNGQLITLRCAIAGTQSEMVVSFPSQPVRLSGVYRTSTHEILNASGTQKDVIMRQNETLTLIGIVTSGLEWLVINHNVDLRDNSDFTETVGGIATASGTATAAGVITLPLTATNTNYQVITSDGGVITAKTTTDFTVDRACDWMARAIVPDYAALGGIASF